MMQVKTRMDNEWEEINRLLEAAGQCKQDAAENTAKSRFTLPADVRTAQDFQSKLDAVYPTRPEFMVDGDIEDYFKAFQAVESYFFMSAEDFVYIMSIVGLEGTSTSNERQWNQVYEKLTATHREMIYDRRRDNLRKTIQPDPALPIGDPFA